MPDARFAAIHLDLVGPLPESEGHSYLLTVVDRFSRWMEAIPLSSITAESCAWALLLHWVSRFGVPSSIVTDRGRQFTSGLWHTRLCPSPMSGPLLVEFPVLLLGSRRLSFLSLCLVFLRTFRVFCFLFMKRAVSALYSDLFSLVPIFIYMLYMFLIDTILSSLPAAKALHLLCKFLSSCIVV